MAKNEKTSKTVASKASKILSNPKSTKAEKSVAASALTQAANKKEEWKMKSIPSRLYALGWNRRVLTFDDFLAVCQRERVVVYETRMRWRGLYFFDSGQPVILLDERLRGHQRTLTAWHELGHHLFAVPGCLVITKRPNSKPTSLPTAP